VNVFSQQWRGSRLAVAKKHRRFVEFANAGPSNDQNLWMGVGAVT
jgi:hypothetical protein